MGFLDIDHLTVRYGSGTAVEDLSLAISRGEFISLLGPSGCGKTTTLRVIAGLQAPSAGVVSLDGAVLTDGPSVTPPERRHMGMVFQSYAIWPHMSVQANVEFGLLRQGVARTVATQRASEMLELVGLAGMGRRFPHELSGGQQQRVALARSLVVKPAVMLLDEPLSNLDARLRESMRLELKRLQEDTGVTFVYVTHDRTEALAMSDRVAVMNHGRLLQFGPPKEVFEHPADAATAAILGEINLIDATVVGAGRVRVGAAEIVATFERSCDSALGASCQLAFRPHVASLSQAPMTSANSLPCEVISVAYLGVGVDYVVDSYGHRVKVTTTSRAEILARGDRCFLNISRDDLVVYGTDAKDVHQNALAAVSES